jgi:hypothetical protein
MAADVHNFRFWAVRFQGNVAEPEEIRCGQAIVLNYDPFGLILKQPMDSPCNCALAAYVFPAKECLYLTGPIHPFNNPASLRTAFLLTDFVGTCPISRHIEF